MSDFSLSSIATAFGLATVLLIQFHKAVTLPKSWVPFNLGGLLALLIGLVPWIKKGSFVAFVVGYMLVTVLMVSMLVLFAMAHLPGQPLVSLPTGSLKAGMILLSLLVAGTVVLAQVLVQLPIRLIVQLKEMIERCASQPTHVV
jgi:hypothetical protein